MAMPMVKMDASSSKHAKTVLSSNLHFVGCAGGVAAAAERLLPPPDSASLSGRLWRIDVIGAHDVSPVTSKSRLFVPESTTTLPCTNKSSSEKSPPNSTSRFGLLQAKFENLTGSTESSCRSRTNGF